MDAIWTAVICVISLAILLVMRWAGAEREMKRLSQELRFMNDKIADPAAVYQRLEGIDSRLHDSGIASQRMGQDIFDTLGRVQEATGQMAEQAREFSTLKDMLRAPKLRGGVGEAMLEELLGQVLPPASYEIQHRFSTGATVDAVVRAGGRLVSVDAKFPLDNFKRICESTSETEKARAERDFARDVVAHINAIATRYIVPDEETLDFALMYLPAEGVYGEVLRGTHSGRPLFDLALEARVVPVGPLTIYGYLQTLLFGLKCLRIGDSAQAILDSCNRLQRDVGGFVRNYETLGGHLRHAVGKYEEGRGSLDRLEDRVARMASLDDVADDDEATDATTALEIVGD